MKCFIGENEMNKYLSEINFINCQWSEISSFVSDYLIDYRITVESYWEDHILESKHYKMILNNDIIGYFSIHGGSTIMLFHVFSEYANVSQELFLQVKKYESVTGAMVVTGDEFFLSHCFDSFSRIEKQAYFSIYTDKEIELYKKKPITLRLADINNEKDVETFKLSGDFLDGEVQNIRNGLDELKIYIAQIDNNIVGFGVIQYGRILKNIASIGMFVREEYRQQAIAANILQGLKSIANEKGCSAFSGCWYYNHNSKKSMESAGAYSKTRMVRFYF